MDDPMTWHQRLTLRRLAYRDAYRSTGISYRLFCITYRG